MACAQNWPVYQNLPSTICTKASKAVSGNEAAVAAPDNKAVLAEANKLSKGFRKNFDAVLQGDIFDLSSVEG